MDSERVTEEGEVRLVEDGYERKSPRGGSEAEESRQAGKS